MTLSLPTQGKTTIKYQDNGQINITITGQPSGQPTGQTTPQFDEGTFCQDTELTVPQDLEMEIQDIEDEMKRIEEDMLLDNVG